MNNFKGIRTPSSSGAASGAAQMDPIDLYRYCTHQAAAASSIQSSAASGKHPKGHRPIFQAATLVLQRVSID